MKRTASFLIAAAGVLSAVPAFAADGLPQFKTELFPEQLFWLAISFGALYFLMKRVALPHIERAQAKRNRIVDTDLQTAKTANAEAKAAGTNAEKALAEARAKSQATIVAIKTEASKLAAEQQAAQDKRIGQRMKDAEAKIAATRDAALKEIEGSASGIAAAIVESVSGIKVKA